MGFIEAMNVAERGLEAWRRKPHNKKWWRRIDGTPIPNDLLVCIAEQMVKATNYVDEGGSVRTKND